MPMLCSFFMFFIPLGLPTISALQAERQDAEHAWGAARARAERLESELAMREAELEAQRARTSEVRKRVHIYICTVVLEMRRLLCAGISFLSL